MKHFLLLGLAILALGACQQDPKTDPPAEPSNMAGCEARGGTWGVAGLLQEPICTLPTPDAGKACSVESDCTGMCMADTKTCSTVTPLFGCHVFLDDDGTTYEMCID
ncbi:hypothetical protein R3X27_08770 [Tropicimonas sp. TH_r6]|uniref:hypothetical protein n=1 Tax=Tropicimonas sp. TH_r6 TaxID=3082085 RepID=UPI0029545927|nr:hypothetical protein [Tropicimonas sp. TH_r6]MDV7142775.1 hypothetical protein [Tropicimonas sp. TH_r6]